MLRIIVTDIRVRGAAIVGRGVIRILYADGTTERPVLGMTEKSRRRRGIATMGRSSWRVRIGACHIVHMHWVVKVVHVGGGRLLMDVRPVGLGMGDGDRNVRNGRGTKVGGRLSIERGAVVNDRVRL